MKKGTKKYIYILCYGYGYLPTLGKMSRQMFLRNTLYNTLSFMLFQAEQSLASTNQWGNVVDGVAVAP